MPTQPYSQTVITDIADPTEVRNAQNHEFLAHEDWVNRRYSAAFLWYQVPESQRRLVNAERLLFMPRYGRDSQIQVDYAAFRLRDGHSLSYERIGRLVGFRGESSARMAVNRYRERCLGVQRGYAYQLGTGGRRRRRQPVNVATRTFGVEIEFKDLDFYYAAEVVQTVTGRHCHSTDYHGRYCLTCRQRVGYAEWKVEHDGSVCRTDEDGDKIGGEAIAPVGSGESHLDEIGRVMVALRTAGATVDSDAGMHVHMNMKDLDRAHLAEFVLMFQAQQSFLWGLLAPSRRSSGYCEHLSLSEAQQMAEQFRQRGNAYGPRGALNVSPYPRLGTFEIRMHQGTLNARKMRAWVSLLLAYAQAVKEDKFASFQPNLSVLGQLTADGYLQQAQASYLFARHGHFSGRNQ